MTEPSSDFSVMVCAANEHGDFDYFDPAWLRFSGTEPAEEQGLGWTRRIHPDDREPFLRAHRAALEGRIAHSARFRLRRADGEHRWIAWTGAPLPSARRAPSSYLGGCVDVTAELRELDELRSFRRAIGLHAETSPAGGFCAVQGPDGDIELPFVSQAACQLLGLEPNELRRDPSRAATVIHPEDRGRILELVQASAHTQEPIAAEFRARGEQAAARWLRLELALMRLPDGHTLWSGHLSDITATKSFETALLESQQHYQSVLRTSIDGYWTTDLRGRFLEVNEAYARLIGYSREELLRMSIQEVEAAESGEETARHIEAVICAGSDRFETRHRARDGRVIDIEVSTVFVPHQGGRLVVFLRDITERKRAEAQRAELLRLEQQARLLAEEANRMKDNFLALLSHELRTPLSTIFSWAQLLRTGRVSPEKMRAVGETLERSARTQAKLIDDLLDVSRIMKGKLSVERSDFDPAAPLLAAVRSVAPQAEAKRIELVVELEGAQDGMLVHADPTRLEQVFNNLLGNAVKFAPPGGKVRVRLDSAERDGHGRTGAFVRVRVADNGPGIPRKLIGRIFEAFFQKDSSTTRAHGGLGLGLAIVKSLVELHGGTVAAESEGEGRGSAFTVWLPLTSKPARSAPAPSRVEPPEKRLEGVQVLVVDDEPQVCEALRGLLSSEGAEVRVAHSAREALVEVRRSRPALLISDIGMPAQDGYSLLRELRTAEQAEGRGRLPVIALTALAGPSEAERAREAGFELHLAKPVDAGLLVSSVRQALGLPAERS